MPILWDVSYHVRIALVNERSYFIYNAQTPDDDMRYTNEIFKSSNQQQVNRRHTDGLVPDCNTSSANALELLQSCTKPSIHVVQMPWS